MSNLRFRELSKIFLGHKTVIVKTEFKTEFKSSLKPSSRSLTSKVYTFYYYAIDIVL